VSCFPEILSVLNFSSSLAERVSIAHAGTIITYSGRKYSHHARQRGFVDQTASVKKNRRVREDPPG
jgi:hypothetical protein